MKFLIFSYLALWGANSWSHGGIDHSKAHHDNLMMDSDSGSDVITLEINQMYREQVKPIFVRSCFDCHSSSTKYPWYYKIPGIKQLIDNDIKEAKKHLDFTDDFPFKSHETPLSDLTAISKSIKNETMPPWKYELMHRDKRLSEKERQMIQDWIEVSIKKLQD